MARTNALRDLVGQELAGFRLIEVLAEGSTSVVFRGESVARAGEVRALKVVRPDVMANPSFAARFAAEVSALAKLDHPAVMRLHGQHHDRDLTVVELELLVGAPMSQRLASQPGGLAIDDVKRWLTQAADGLAAAHALGVLHGNLDLDALFVTSDGALKLRGFVPPAASEDDSGTQTAMATSAVALAYVAPEVCTGGKPTAAADVYALGLLLFEVVTGAHPLLPPLAERSRLSPAEVMVAQTTKPVPALDDVRRDAPPVLADIVARAVAKNPTYRFTAEAMSAALRDVRSSVAPKSVAVPAGTLLMQERPVVPAAASIAEPAVPPTALPPTVFQTVVLPHAPKPPPPPPAPAEIAPSSLAAPALPAPEPPAPRPQEPALGKAVMGVLAPVDLPVAAPPQAVVQPPVAASPARTPEEVLLGFARTTAGRPPPAAASTPSFETSFAVPGVALPPPHAAAHDRSAELGKHTSFAVSPIAFSRRDSAPPPKASASKGWQTMLGLALLVLIGGGVAVALLTGGDPAGGTAGAPSASGR
jgi:serine/threonine-protein kinase